MIVAVALVVASAAFLIIPRDDMAVLERFSPEHVTFYAVVDSAPQRLAFLLFLLMIVSGGLALPLLKRTVSRNGLSPKIYRQANGWLNFDWSKLHLIVGAMLFVAILINLGRGVWVLSGAAILVSAVVIGRYSRAVWMIWAMTSALVILAILPGWIGTPIPIPKYLFWHDTHYAAVLSQGERLAAGHLLFQNNSPLYGILVPIVVGIIAHIENAMSFAGLLRLTQGSQTLCLITILIAAWLRTRNSPALGRALAFLFIALASASFVNTLGSAIWTPNQSGLRFVMLPVAVIVACVLGRMAPHTRSMIVGLTVGSALLYNTETGIAIAAGLGLAWLISVRSEPLATAVTSAVVGLATMAAVFGVVAIIYHVAFAGWPFPTNYEDAIAHIKLFASGGGGRPLKLRAPAIIILIHSSYLVTRALRHLASPQARTPSIPDTAIAGIILAWFPYWINRSYDNNLWSHIVLYALLLAPAIATQGRRLIPLIVAALFILPVPMKYAKPELLAPLSKERLILGWHRGCGDGLILPPMLCTHLRARAMVLEDWADEGDVVWITGLPMLTMRMTGLHGTFPTIDLFNGAPTPATFNQLVNKIQVMQPRAIFLDLPIGYDLHDAETNLHLGIPWNIQAFYDRLLAAIGADSCPSQLVGGWRLVEITGDCKKSAENKSVT